MSSGDGDTHRVYDVFLVVRSVIDSLASKNRLQFPVPVKKPDGILGVVEEQIAPSGIECVNVFCRDWRSEQLRSALFRRTKSADIHYSVRAPLDWRRLSLCKEAMHLLIDKESCHFTTDPLSLIEKLIVGDFASAMASPDNPMSSEWMGLVAALETVLPWKLRPVLQKMVEAEESDYQISIQTKVPEKYVTAMLHGHYGKWSESINRALDGM